MSDGYRSDLELAPGAGFRLRRRFGARIFSALLLLAAVGWGALDLWIGYRVVGALTLALAAAFVAQFAAAELESFWFDGALVHRSFRSFQVEVERVDAHRIRGVQVALEGRRARAWVELVGGDELPLVEGEEQEVRRIAGRLADFLSQPAPHSLH